MYILKAQTRLSSKDLKALATSQRYTAVSSTTGTINVYNHITQQTETLNTPGTYASSLLITKDKFRLIAGCQNGTILIYTKQDSPEKPFDEFKNNDSTSNKNDLIINKKSKNNYKTCDESINFFINNKSNSKSPNNGDINTVLEYIHDKPTIHLKTLNNHKGNVCSLDYNCNILISSSWDNTIRSWDLQNLEQTNLYDLGCCVWSVKLLPDSSSFIAGLANKTIIIYKNGLITQSFMCHLAPVRGLCLFQNNIFSVGNDGKVMKNEEGRIVKITDLNDFLYSIDVSHENVAVCGENGRVVIMDRELNIVYDLKLNVESLWAVRICENGVIICGSDGLLYHYEFKKENIMNESNLINGNHNENIFVEKKDDINEEKDKFNPEIGDIKINDSCNNIKEPNENDKEINENELNSHLQTKDGYKVYNGKVYYREDGKWSLIGDVIEKKFDHSFDVEVEGKFLKINFNEKDNIYDVAEKFLNENNLNKEYKNDIISFIKKNFKPKESFFMYKEININGIKKYLNDDLILENLLNPDKRNNLEIEKKLKNFLCEENNFYVLDCYRFFVAHDFEFDFLFLQDYDFNEKKRATVFLRLVINLYSRQPYNLEILKEKIRKIIDYKLADEESISNYKKNREIANK